MLSEENVLSELRMLSEKVLSEDYRDILYMGKRRVLPGRVP